MKKITILIACLAMIGLSQVNAGVCVRQVNQNNNGACDLEMAYNSQTDSWELTSAVCVFLMENTLGVKDCILLFEEPEDPSLIPA